MIYMTQWFSHVGDKVQLERKQNETLLPGWEISGCITQRERECKWNSVASLSWESWESKDGKQWEFWRQNTREKMHKEKTVEICRGSLQLLIWALISAWIWEYYLRLEKDSQEKSRKNSSWSSHRTRNISYSHNSE